MKNIYIVLTNTGTTLSKIITHFMNDDVSHVSLSLDKNLKKMYSFGRLNPYNPFLGGFVHEGKNKRTFRRFKETKSIITELEVTDEQYSNLEEIITNIKKHRREFKFNVTGLFAIYFNKKIEKDKHFYCAEFIKYITEKAKIDLELPELVRPQDFKNIKNGKIIYEGIFNEYKIKNNPINNYSATQKIDITSQKC